MFWKKMYNDVQKKREMGNLYEKSEWQPDTQKI